MRNLLTKIANVEDIENFCEEMKINSNLRLQ